jgi:dipeptidyl aminopeptidase/acylaminoacyl peptidase
MLPILHFDHDFSSLCVTYRNDPLAPEDPDGIYRQGSREWEDIEPAVQYALDRGASEVLLVGYSMGGQITANFLRHSDLADEIDAVIWDAPVLDWGPAIAAGAVERGVPGWLVPIGMQASEWRAGIDYEDLNQVANAEEFNHPILVLHGTEDGTVPVSTSKQFAKTRSDIVSLDLFPDAGHVASWNSHPERYRQSVNRFITDQFVR